MKTLFIHLKLPIILVLVCSLVFGCATYKVKYKEKNVHETPIENKSKVQHTFYLVGDAGGSSLGETSKGLKILQKVVDTVLDKSKNSLIFLGDNIYRKGLVDVENSNYELAKHRLDVELEIAKIFKGKTYFIPGNHDWYCGLKGLKRQERYVEKALDRNKSFEPDNGCPITNISVNDDIELVILDTQWFLTNWDERVDMNKSCEIKTRAAFFVALDGVLKKNNNKTVLIAMHHPMVSDGPHGGKFSIDNHLYPRHNKTVYPILGSMSVFLRAHGGISKQDLTNPMNARLMQRLYTMAKSHGRVIFTSGHDHSLQYLEKDGVSQILSGSGSKVSSTSLGPFSKFSAPKQGIAVLKIYNDGHSDVSYIGATSNYKSSDVSQLEKLYETKVLDAYEQYTYDASQYEKQDIQKSIYENDYGQKSKLGIGIMGNHYKQLYTHPFDIKQATLDTLYGGVTILRKGGGQQTRSLRLIDQNGSQYSMRAVQKSATQFLQKAAFPGQYMNNYLEKTLPEKFIIDFYTGVHPFAAIPVSELCESINILHTNPYLYYIPKHKAMGQFNEDFGNELFLIEARPDDGHLDKDNFGKPDDIVSTADLLQNLRKNEKHEVDSDNYIRARLFDILIGDWDRHTDQWRWAKFKTEDGNVYKPIPRDRDQAFCNYDGTLNGFIKLFVPITRKFLAYGPEIKNIRWINNSGIKTDRLFTAKATIDDWIKQAKYIEEHLTDKKIEEAFASIPDHPDKPVNGKIMKDLKSRRGQLVDAAKRYYEYLSKLAVVVGTDKKDVFQIIRQDKKTIINVFLDVGKKNVEKRLLKKPNRRIVLDEKNTKELWVYGLDDDDVFQTIGYETNDLKIRIIGGYGKDVYNIYPGNKIIVYDSKIENSQVVQQSGTNNRSAKFIFSNRYENNLFDHNRVKENTFSSSPLLDVNPDDGLRVSITSTVKRKGFHGNNYDYHSNLSNKHQFKAGYFVATKGLVFNYEGSFINKKGNLEYQLNAFYNSSNFTQNYFGLGNNTINEVRNSDEFNFNRIRLQQEGLRLSLLSQRYNLSKLTLSAGYRGVAVDKTPDRFLEKAFNQNLLDSQTFDKKQFVDLKYHLNYNSIDNKSLPTRGFDFNLSIAGIMNINKSKNTFASINPSFTHYFALVKSRKLIFSNSVGYQLLSNDKYEFYQSARLGADNGLRAYRRDRFAGTSALYFSHNIRYNFNQFHTALLPASLGLFAGVDYGRVWIADESSNNWHSNVGGGFAFNMAQMLDISSGYFIGQEGGRFTIKLSTSF